MWKKVWADPVWSKVIASAIVAVVAYLLVDLGGWWGTLGALCSKVFKALASPVSVPMWAFLSLAAIAVLVFVFIAARIWDSRIDQSQPDWTRYTKDEFHGLVWRWGYGQTGKLSNLACFCPRCDFQVTSSQSSYLDHSTWVDFFCAPCGKHTLIRDMDFGDLEEEVRRRIQQKMRTNSFPGATSN